MQKQKKQIQINKNNFVILAIKSNAALMFNKFIFKIKPAFGLGHTLYLKAKPITQIHSRIILGFKPKNIYDVFYLNY